MNSNRDGILNPKNRIDLADNKNEKKNWLIAGIYELANQDASWGEIPDAFFKCLFLRAAQGVLI